MTRNWDNLKKRIAKEQRFRCQVWNRSAGVAAVIAAIPDREPKAWRLRVKELADMVYARIMAWDIRCAGKLLECFPDYLPKSVRGETPEATMDYKGDWQLVW